MFEIELFGPEKGVRILGESDELDEYPMALISCFLTANFGHITTQTFPSRLRTRKTEINCDQAHTPLFPPQRIQSSCVCHLLS